MNTLAPRPVGTAVCPEHLPQDAKLMWQTVMDSVPPGMITPVDAPLLADYCLAWAIHKQATEELHRSRDLLGNMHLVIDGKPSPYVRIINEQATVMARLAGKLGLSPADRSGLKLGNVDEGNPWSEILSE